MTKLQLVLDVAGVIITNLSPRFWLSISDSAGMDYETLKHHYRQEIREALWTGNGSEAEFWQWLKGQCPSVETAYAQQLLKANLTRLPAYDRIVEWSRLADIHLLSNHRKEWIEPILESIKSSLTSMTISSVAGVCKSDPAIFERVQSGFDNFQPVIYVDDQEKNLMPARSLGWETILADSEGRWIDYVGHRLIGEKKH
jgi:HAD superfamily hydrolase (TIGR01509 family)